LYIWSLGLQITKVSSGPTVPSGSVALGANDYKKTPGARD
jgi:hypothetical protein